MKKLYDLVSKPTAIRKLSCSDCMTATNAFRKSLGVILFIACLKPIVASITHITAGRKLRRYDAPTNRLLNAYVEKQYPSAMNVKATVGSLSASKTGIQKGADALVAKLN